MNITCLFAVRATARQKNLYVFVLVKEKYIPQVN